MKLGSIDYQSNHAEMNTSVCGLTLFDSTIGMNLSHDLCRSHSYEISCNMLRVKEE